MAEYIYGVEQFKNGKPIGFVPVFVTDDFSKLIHYVALKQVKLDISCKRVRHFHNQLLDYIYLSKNDCVIVHDWFSYPKIYPRTHVFAFKTSKKDNYHFIESKKKKTPSKYEFGWR